MNRVRKKLREAAFFLEELRKRADLAFGDREPFDFYLSAFLSAGRSVDYRLRHEEKAYAAFRKSWDKSLSPSDKALMKFMVDDRNFEVHDSGSARIQGSVRVPIGSYYRDASGTVTVAGPVGEPPAEIIKPTFSFTMSGHAVPVVECCAGYLELLEQLVADYCRHSGAP